MNSTSSSSQRPKGTFRKLSDVAKRAIEEIGHKLGPEDDWHPMLLVGTRTGEFSVVQLPGEFLNNYELKQILWHKIIPGIANRMDAEQVVFVSTAWMAAVDPKLMEGLDPEDISKMEFPRASEAKNRKEVVLATVVDRERVECWMAEIKRTAVAPPHLDPWEVWDDQNLTGDMVEPLRKALR